jgi:hypothetical protein
MNDTVKKLVETEAYRKGIAVDPSFFSRSDGYIQKHFRDRSAKDQLTVESYIAQAAIRIAATEGKRRLEGEDFKAAVWLFHQPEQPDDPCVAAGQMALAKESVRSPLNRGMLMESFAKNLNAQLGKSQK